MKQRTRFTSSTHRAPRIDTPPGWPGFDAPSRNRASVRLNDLCPDTTGAPATALMTRARVLEACMGHDP